MPRKKAAGRTRRGGRASWKGNLTFGLVSFSVEAFNAIDREGSDIHFHQLHRECHSRIHYDKVCPIHGKVSNEEIVSGYEHRKGKYVEFDPDELDSLRTEGERALRIDAFIAPDALDPIFFDGRMYYLTPAESAAKGPFDVLRTAMEREERFAVGRIVFSGKEQVALVRPMETIFHMALLNYAAEIKPPKKFAGSVAKSVGSSRQLTLARTLVREWSDESFDFDSYEDHYREQVEKLITAKVKGEEIVAPEIQDEEPHTINLMDALKRSLGKEKATPKRRSKPRKRSA